MDVIDKFELKMTAQSEKVCRENSLVMTPMVDGELDRGTQLPLEVSIAPREDDTLAV